jgi:hypothetical protein
MRLSRLPPTGQRQFSGNDHRPKLTRQTPWETMPLSDTTRAGLSSENIAEIVVSGGLERGHLGAPRASFDPHQGQRSPAARMEGAGRFGARWGYPPSSPDTPAGDLLPRGRRLSRVVAGAVSRGLPDIASGAASSGGCLRPGRRL